MENHPRALKTLQHNLAELSLEKRARIDNIDIYGSIPPGWDPFDIIFLDPPFANYGVAQKDPWRLAFSLVENHHLREDGILGLEAPATVAAPEAPEGLIVEKDRRYGETRIKLWRKTHVR